MTGGQELDLLGARAWPAPEEEIVHGWRLRFGGGITKRANSVLPLRAGDEVAPNPDALNARITSAEAGYRARGLPPRFHLTAASWPAELRSVLLARGYSEHDPTLVMAGDLTRFPTPPDRSTTVTGVPGAAWLECWWEVDGRGGDDALAIARTILAGVTLPVAFVEHVHGGRVVGVGMGVLDGDWLGVQCMATLPAHRRRGAATAVLAALAAWGRDRHAMRAHLAVTAGNAGARRLYERAGLITRGSYAYLTAGT